MILFINVIYLFIFLFVYFIFFLFCQVEMNNLKKILDDLQQTSGSEEMQKSQVTIDRWK